MFHIRPTPRSQNMEAALRPAFSLRHPTRPPLRPGCETLRRFHRLSHRCHGLRNSLRLGEGRAASQTGRRDSHEHEIGILACPAQRLLLRFEKPVDHNRVAFQRGPSGKPRCLATADRATGIHGQQRSIRQRDSTSVRNLSRIDRAVTCPQSRAGRSDVAARPVVRSATAAGPVNRHARENSLLRSARDGSEQQHQ